MARRPCGAPLALGKRTRRLCVPQLRNFAEAPWRLHAPPFEQGLAPNSVINHPTFNIAPRVHGVISLTAAAPALDRAIPLYSGLIHAFIASQEESCPRYWLCFIVA